MSSDTIVEVTAVERVVRLPKPLSLGPMRITSRHYTVVSVLCSSGVSGGALAQTRGAPIAEIVERLLAPAVVGHDAEGVEERWNDAFGSTIAIGRTGLVMRALSLLDLALWDARGRRAGQPVWELLGCDRSPVPVIYVAGYPSDPADVEDVCARAAAAADRGHRTIKIARTPGDPTLTKAVLDHLDDLLPDGIRVAVDGNWGYGSVNEALEEVAAWPAHRVAWLEDPYPPEEVGAIADLRRDAPVAVAAGDDLTDRGHATRLLERDAVDLLRLDVAAIGGFTGARPLLLRARAAAVPVSFHISPEASIHLAALSPTTTSIETFDRAGNDLDPSHELVIGGPTFEDGCAVPRTSPGLGFEVRDAQA